MVLMEQIAFKEDQKKKKRWKFWERHEMKIT